MSLDDEDTLNSEIPELNYPPAHEADTNNEIGQREIVLRCLAGDEQAFAWIADQYGNLLLRTAYLLVRDEEAAKDIVQETLILAWKNMEKLREPAYLRAWLLKIVLNQSISLKRRWGRRAALLREQLTNSYTEQVIQIADFQRGHIEDTIDLAQAIEQLPAKQRVVLVLFYYHRMTMPEIADIVGVAENTLRKRLQAALDKIRRMLGADLPGNRETLFPTDQVKTHITIHRGSGS